MAENMNESLPLYNSNMMRSWEDFIKYRYPKINFDDVLKYAGITRSEVNDRGHWFNQNQADRLCEFLRKKTGNENISRDAGRFVTSSKGMGVLFSYIVGLLSIQRMYLIMGSLYNRVSRGAVLTSSSSGRNSVEILRTPAEGVNEKLYQCGNTVGCFESAAKLFIGKFAKVEHPECYHRGDKACRYIVFWEETASGKWKRIRNYCLLLSLI